jgi:hypothetical protein
MIRQRAIIELTWLRDHPIQELPDGTYDDHASDTRSARAEPAREDARLAGVRGKTLLRL